MQTKVHIIDKNFKVLSKCCKISPKAFIAIYVKKPKLRGKENMLKFIKVKFHLFYACNT